MPLGVRLSWEQVKNKLKVVAIIQRSFWKSEICIHNESAIMAKEIASLLSILGHGRLIFRNCDFTSLLYFENKMWQSSLGLHSGLGTVTYLSVNKTRAPLGTLMDYF
jgi:hypothetical protein